MISNKDQKYVQFYLISHIKCSFVNLKCFSALGMILQKNNFSTVIQCKKAKWEQWVNNIHILDIFKYNLGTITDYLAFFKDL